jgi:hypothetical protein
VRFQVRNIARNNGVGHVQRLRGPGKTAVFHHLGKHSHRLKPVHAEPYYPDLRNIVLPVFTFFAQTATVRLRFMDRRTRLTSRRNPQATLNKLLRRNTMNASKLFTAVAAIVFAGSAAAADVPVATAAITAAAASQLTVTAQKLNIPAVLVNKSAGRTRAEVRAEAIDAVQNYRATEASQFEWISK